MKRAYVDEFLIDGEPMLSPDAGVHISCTDLEGDTERDEGGFLHRQVVRANIRTWKFSYGVLTAEEYAYLRSLLRGKETFLFSFCNEDAEQETVKAYCKETGAAWWSHSRSIYKEMEFSIIEC